MYFGKNLRQELAMRCDTSLYAEEGERIMPTDTVAESLGRPSKMAIGGNVVRQPTRVMPIALANDVDRLFALARTRLTRLARFSGATIDQAEDIVQETLLTAWLSVDQLRDPTRFD